MTNIIKFPQKYDPETMGRMYELKTQYLELSLNRLTNPEDREFLSVLQAIIEERYDELTKK